jgi:hypothetical protein
VISSTDTVRTSCHGRLMIERANLGAFAREHRVQLGREPAANAMRFKVCLS